MRITAMTTMAVLAGAGSWAGESRMAAEPKVTVCLALDQHPIESHQARRSATKMFSDIGVQVEWRTDKHSCAAKGAIVINLTEDTPRGDRPDAFAVALPYEGVHIRVFYDRIKEFIKPPAVPSFLAHVLAHEITHILQGIHRHSESGVMKAHWSHEDIWEMEWKPLAFTEEDVYLIHHGLKERAARLAAVDGAAAKVATQ